MKRDKNLIKAILIYAEEYEGNKALINRKCLPEFENISLRDFMRHSQLILDKKLAKGYLSRHSEGFVVESITWEGYEFLDDARQHPVWNAATQAAGDMSWKVFTQVLTDTATAFAKSLLH
jgi:hypothetical protein